MRLLRYVFGTDDRIQIVIRSAIQRLLEGVATAIVATFVLSAGAGISIQWAAGCFALISVGPPLLRIIAEGIPGEQRQVPPPP